MGQLIDESDYESPTPRPAPEETLGKPAMGQLIDESDYESLRNARILENKARMASLGISERAGELRAIISPAKPNSASPRKSWKERTQDVTSLRRSDRLKGKLASAAAVLDDASETEKTRFCVRRCDSRSRSPVSETEKTRFCVRRCDSRSRSPVSETEKTIFCDSRSRGLVSETEKTIFLARRCDSRGRGSVYDSVVGICCHFCRQKKLCGEEDCRRCGDRDIDLPCIGKTDCSVCHSSNGILCRACLKVRYGEELEEVRENKEWMCPHCVEEKGIRPYWICNSSFCLKKRKMMPTGIAIYQARSMGYKSVAHLLMAKLKATHGEAHLLMAKLKAHG